jgi:ABC-type multidrug transport system ATPase subunit
MNEDAEDTNVLETSGESGAPWLEAQGEGPLLGSAKPSPETPRKSPSSLSESSSLPTPDSSSDTARDRKTASERLRPWRIRFADQFLALCGKQALVYWRNWLSTLLRVLSPLMFMFLLWLLDIAFRTDNQNLPAYLDNKSPAVVGAGGIPSCSEDLFIKSPCWDFLYSPNTSSVARDLVDGIRLNNPGGVIAEENVIGFESIESANAFLAANPERVPGGVHFLLGDEGTIDVLDGPSPIDFVLVANTTVKSFKDQYQDPTFFFNVPMQVAVEREIAAYQWRMAGREGSVEWNVSSSMFAHPTTQSVNIVGQAIGPFIFAANMFNFVLLMSSIVSEKERGLRQALKTSGMLDSAFWLSWVFIELVISVIFSLLLVGFGAMFGFAFFLKNSFAVVFVLFLVFQWAMVGLAFFLAPFIGTSNGAINTGFVVFIVGWIFQAIIAFDYPYTPEYIGSIPIVTAIFTLIPPDPLAKGSIDLGRAAEEGKGISWARRNEYCQNLNDPDLERQLYASNPDAYWDFDCVFPMGTIMGVLALEFIVYVLVGIYLDNIVPNENGVRKPIWYLFSPTYWGIGRSKSSQIKLQKPIPCPFDDSSMTNDEDVLEEEARVKSWDSTGRVSDGEITVLGLQKRFPRSLLAAFVEKLPSLRCFSRKRPSRRKASSKKSKSQDFWAIKGSWFSIKENTIFCLLGPNGAGKTTTINCLTGVLPPSGGDALIHGESIVATGGMDRIRSYMGVCPQFDVLWKELTGMEHMKVFARIKGLNRTEVHEQAESLIESVKLTEAASMRTGAYSGGMRRRLSVAMALLGDPLVVYLDEPTTGMDPISRRHVWDTIEAAKKNRIVVLTTHSMEEADILGDSIAIMARGKIRAFGSSIRLKNKFGSGYQLSVSVDKKLADVHSLDDFMEKTFLVDSPTDIRGSYAIYSLPKQIEPKLPESLKLLQQNKEKLGIVDVQIQMTSLEEVFLNIAKQAEIDAAHAEGEAVEEVALEDGSTLEVVLGHDTAHHPETGARYDISWSQGEDGSLQVSQWTKVGDSPAETPTIK